MKKFLQFALDGKSFIRASVFRHDSAQKGETGNLPEFGKFTTLLSCAAYQMVSGVKHPEKTKNEARRAGGIRK